MRRSALLVTITLLVTGTALRAQITTDPATGNVGIGTTSPNAKLQVSDNGRNYFVNRAIPGLTEDSQGDNYILLHPSFTGSLMADHHVIGKITGVRGDAGAWNRKWTVEVNTASAYDADRGSIISYNEGADLVTLDYNGNRYMAVRIRNASSLYYFSFTGYAAGETLQLVTDNNVSNVQVFKGLDRIAMQGALGVGTITPGAVLHVTGSGANKDGGNDHQFSGDMVIEGATGGRTSGIGSQIEFVLPANTDGSNVYGQARIITVAGNNNNYDATGKMILGTRRMFNKLGTGPQWYYGDDIVIDGVGNIGIGTINPVSKLSVNGDIKAKKIRVEQNWADYVFDSSYQLRPLDDVKKFIQANNHLPDMPSAKEVESKGLDLGEVVKQQQVKIEELTLYLLNMEKQNKMLIERIEKLEKTK
jgi:ethanolamine utilization microcompartment shell protein EutS